MTEAGRTKTRPKRVSPMAALRGLLKNYVVAIAGAAIIALLLRVYVVEAFRIPTDLMSPALLPGDHIFVNKLAYAVGEGMPQRGDIVILSMPDDPAKDYVKRVVALPGDKIGIRDSAVILNGAAIGSTVGADPDVLEESLDGRPYQAQWVGASPESRNMAEVIVPAGQVFVLGDHRGKGQDSRSWGFLPVTALKGRVSLIWFSMDKDGDGSVGVRWSRLLTKVR